MANTGVLPFVRGVDFSKNDFGVSVPSVALITPFLTVHFFLWMRES